MIDAALLLLRSVIGGLLAGHGAQKLFGAFDGPGLEATRGMMRALRMEPHRVWGTLAGGTELAGGALTASGLLGPVGPVVSMAPMAMATTTVHWGKPIWVTEGGAELPVTNLAVLGALALGGPGTLSLDRVLGIRMPRWVALAAMGGVAAGTALALATRRPAEDAEPAPAPAEQPHAEAPAEEEERELAGRRAEQAQPQAAGEAPEQLQQAGEPQQG
jgi:putative oxidoreductase